MNGLFRRYAHLPFMINYNALIDYPSQFSESNQLYERFCAKTRLGELEAALASTTQDSVVGKEASLNMTSLSNASYDIEDWMRVDDCSRSAEHIREKWGLFEGKRQ